ncbi:hypothetical protein [Acinetobacter calcoaceticus]|uniref:hypothetical protein n=1 Tax=Acinetobacter calcoaceticus TaxID=471 RepID=UPI001AE3B100|nr:hypothetical protein [Acinetobacter calcoaceticus]MBP2602691.1 tetratricopeptide (TPR) repeat protein [Acinetobacter calcoaceticus]
MGMLAPKKRALEILEQIGVFGRKDATEFKIQRWKTQAKSLAENNIVESKRILAIIAVYENNLEVAHKNFDQALALSNYENSLVFSDFAQALLMLGKGEDALIYLVRAFNIEPTGRTLDRILTLSNSLVCPDVLNEVLTLVKKLNVNTEVNLSLIEETNIKINENVEFLEKIGVSVSSYRLMINLSNLVLFSKFYTQTKIAAFELDDMVNTIIYPEHLTADDISELNDDFVENIIKADIPLDDLLKISFYFSLDHLDSRDVA